MLKEPRFQEDRLALAKEQALQEMKKRNDDAEDIEGTEWNALLYGESHFTNHFTTEASIKSITRDDLVAFHRREYHPANMVAAVSGVVLPGGDDPEARDGVRELARSPAAGSPGPGHGASAPPPASTACRRT